jgi:hypothetical protein
VSDPHFNIFHAYRGPVSFDEARERQLEDNLTRALIVTLSTVRNPEARRFLLDELGYPDTEPDDVIQYRLQVGRPDPNWPPPANRHLLVIHGGSDLAIVPGEDQVVTGRVDAVIASRRHLLAIESKLGDSVNAAQLERHRKTLTIHDQQTLATSWARMARTARTALARSGLPPVDRFVVSQFEEYLSMNGFSGLTEEHLAYFAQPQDRRDGLVKEGVRRSLDALISNLAREWQTSWSKRVGNIGQASAGAWAKLESDRPGPMPHLTVGIGPAGLDIFGNVETHRPYQKFRAALKQDSREFIRILRDLGSEWPPSVSLSPPWRLRILRRIPTGRPRNYDEWQAVDVVVALFADWSEEHVQWFVDNVTRQPESEWAPEITLTRSYPAALLFKDDDLAKRLCADATQLEPFFAWLGVPVR